MKKTPRKTKQWALEAYSALEQAIDIFQREFPAPSDSDKLQLISFSVPLAALNRGIEEKSQLEQANDYVLENLSIDLDADSEGGPFHSISFLIAYLDAHIAFGLINQKKAEDIMHHLTDHYEICREL